MVLAYATVAAPPTDELLDASYLQLCLEATTEVKRNDIVLVWHDMMRCDEEEVELHRVVSSAPWRALFMVPAYQGQPPCAACVGGEGAEVVQ